MEAKCSHWSHSEFRLILQMEANRSHWSDSEYGAYLLRTLHSCYPDTNAKNLATIGLYFTDIGYVIYRSLWWRKWEPLEPS